jgi:transposase-like protein
MSDQGERVDGGERSVIGAGLPRRVGGRGDRFDKGSGESKALEAAKAGDLGPVDARNPQGLRKPLAMPVEDFLAIRKLTDVELAEKVLALKVYRANGYSLARAARALGVPIGMVREWQVQARERKLALPAIDQAGAHVEDNLVEMAVDSLAVHLKQKNLEATLATLRGTGVLRNNDAPVDGRLPTTLTVNIVDADGVIVSVGNKAPVLEGVVGRPKAHAADLPVLEHDL